MFGTIKKIMYYLDLSMNVNRSLPEFNLMLLTTYDYVRLKF